MEGFETVAKATTGQKVAKGQEASPCSTQSKLVIFLPALCCKMGIPYVIAKGSAWSFMRGQLLLQDIKSKDQCKPASLISTAKSNL